MRTDRNTAIILAGGKGKRMNSAVPKQYLLLRDKPVLFYALNTFSESDLIDEIILVTGADQIEYCRTEIVEKYSISKVSSIVAGGKERYLSVYNGIKAIKSADNIFIHDGARPFVTKEIIERTYKSVVIDKACVTAMPVKDTIKIADSDGYVRETPTRSLVWTIQTPQVFQKELIEKAYQKLIESGRTDATDDAMVAETMLHAKVRLVEGSYQNIKITTPEDLLTGEHYI